MAEHDLVIAADGVNSAVRAAFADAFQPTPEGRFSKFMWLGTDLVFEAFTFHIVETECGIFQIHGYPYDETMSTFIVETDEATWRRAGFDAHRGRGLRPGRERRGGDRALPRDVRRAAAGPRRSSPTTRSG